MGRRVAPLVPDEFVCLPERCRRCLFWELGHPRPGLWSIDDELGSDRARQKQAWCSVRAAETGPPGRAVSLDERHVAYALFAPAAVFAARRPPVPRPSDDALFLATLWVEPDHREVGVGRLLVHAAVREAVDRGSKAVEAYGDRRYREQDCVLPSQWLLHLGFTVAREHPRYPLLRLDVRRTMRWAESLEHALDEVLERLPRRAPAPQRAPHFLGQRPPLR